MSLLPPSAFQVVNAGVTGVIGLRGSSGSMQKIGPEMDTAIFQPTLKPQTFTFPLPFPKLEISSVQGAKHIKQFVVSWWWWRYQPSLKGRDMGGPLSNCVPLPGRHRCSCKERSGWRCECSGPGGTSRGRDSEAGEELRLLKEGPVGMADGHKIDIFWQWISYGSAGMLQLIYFVWSRQQLQQQFWE